MGDAINIMMFCMFETLSVLFNTADVCNIIQNDMTRKNDLECFSYPCQDSGINILTGGHD